MGFALSKIQEISKKQVLLSVSAAEISKLS